MFKVFEAEHETVATRYEQDKVFIYMAGELVTMILNSSNQSVVETLRAIAKNLVADFRITFAHLLVEAEKSNQPKRLNLLKELWMADLK